MDYGKMAYLKAEELEAKLSGTAETKIQPAVYRFTLAGGEKKILKAAGTEKRAVILKADAVSEGGDIYLCIGGKRAARARLESGKDGAVMFAAGDGEIAVDAKELSGVERLECQLLLPSGGGSDDGDAAEIKAAVNGEKYALCYVEDGCATVLLTDGKLSETKRLDLGCARFSDVAAAGGGFYVGIDDGTQLWGVSLSADGKTLVRNPLGESLEEFSLTAVNDAVYFFFAESGQAKYFSTSYPRGARGQTAAVDHLMQIERASAVKGAFPLCIAAESAGGVYLLKEQTDERRQSFLCVKLDGRIEDV